MCQSFFSLSLACTFHSIPWLAHCPLPVTSSSLLNFTKLFLNPLIRFRYPLFLFFFLPGIFCTRLIYNFCLYFFSYCLFFSVPKLCFHFSSPDLVRWLSLVFSLWLSLLRKTPCSLSFWDILLSWYSFYFSGHSLLASYAYTKVMVVHRVLVSRLWIFSQVWPWSMYYPTTSLRLFTGISRLSRGSKLILSFPLQTHLLSNSSCLRYWYHQDNMCTSSSLTCDGHSETPVLLI